MQVISKDLLIENLKVLTYQRGTTYINNFPYNCGFCHDNDVISGDCWCLFKTIIWSHGTLKDNHTPGKYFYTNGAYINGSLVEYMEPSGLEDVDGNTIMSQCKDVSSDFTNMVPGEVLLWSDKSHWGHYVGEFTDESGVVNTIECTPVNGYQPSFGGGVVSSYTDAYGTRYDHKGGTPLGNWGWHGKPVAWVSGYDEPQPVPPTPPTPTVDVIGLAIQIWKGDWGVNPEREQNITAKYGAEMYRKAQDRVNFMDKVFKEKTAANEKAYNDNNLAIQLADEILKDVWGVNPEREQNITAKYGAEMYRKAQDIVNETLK